MNTDVKKLSQIIIPSVFFLLIIFYAFFRSNYLIVGVKIKNVNMLDETSSPIVVQSGGKVANSVLKIMGKAENAKNLSLNGREISINEVGDFDETIALLSGYNIINIKAQDKFGYIDEKNYQLTYEAESL